MVVKKQRIYPSITKQKTEDRRVSRLFRFLIRINAFPLKADFQKNHLSFAFCSRQTLVFSIYLSSFFIVGQVGQGRDFINKYFMFIV